METLTTFARGMGRFAVSSLTCGLIGLVSGAILAGLTGLPFFPPTGPAVGSIIGAIGGLVAGFIGGSFGGSPGFRIGGIVGAVIAIAIYPLMIILWFIPPVLALAVGYFYGAYLDRELKQERPTFFVARILKYAMGETMVYPNSMKYSLGLAGSLIILIVTGLCLRYEWHYIFDAI